MQLARRSRSRRALLAPRHRRRPPSLVCAPIGAPFEPTLRELALLALALLLSAACRPDARRRRRLRPRPPRQPRR
jgi:hypothetical protein